MIRVSIVISFLIIRLSSFGLQIPSETTQFKIEGTNSVHDSLHYNVQELEPVVFSVSRRKEKRSSVASQVSLISKKEILVETPQTAADMLATLPGVRVQKSQFGGGSPVLRGMEANRVLLVIDGVRMNNAIYRMGHLQNSITVSPLMLERTEVLFGPSSVMYGSDALGGVVHYYTKRPSTADTFTTRSSLYGRYSSVNNEYTGVIQLEMGAPKWASYTSVSGLSVGNLVMGTNRWHGYTDWGKVPLYSNNTPNYYSEEPQINKNLSVQPNTDFTQLDLLQKFYMPLTENSDWIVNLQYSTSSDVKRFDRLTEYQDGQLKFAEWYYGPQQRLLASSQLKIAPNYSWLVNGNVTMAYQSINESRIQRKFGSLDKLYRKEHVDVWSLNGDFTTFLTKESTQRLHYGLEAVHNIVSSDSYGKKLLVDRTSITGFSEGNPVQSRYPDGGSTYSTLAAYVNYQNVIHKKGELTLGARYVETFLSAIWVDTIFVKMEASSFKIRNRALTGSAGYTFKPTNRLQFNTVLSTGFRSPNIDDIGKVREKQGKVTVPNVSLKPEFAYSGEVGVVSYLTERLIRLELTGYYTLLNRYITRDTFLLNGSSSILYDGELLPTYANVNKGNAHVTGVTLALQGSLSEFIFMKGDITYTQGETYDTKQPLSSIPPLFGSLSLGYKRRQFACLFTWQFNGAKKLETYNLIEGIDNVAQSPYDKEKDLHIGTPSWHTFDLNIQYHLRRYLTFYFRIDNIFDVHYKEFASAISAPGRNISLAVAIDLVKS